MSRFRLHLVTKGTAQCRTRRVHAIRSMRLDTFMTVTERIAKRKHRVWRANNVPMFDRT